MDRFVCPAQNFTPKSISPFKLGVRDQTLGDYPRLNLGQSRSEASDVMGDAKDTILTVIFDVLPHFLQCFSESQRMQARAASTLSRLV